MRQASAGRRGTVPPEWVRWCILGAVAVAAVVVLAASRTSSVAGELFPGSRECGGLTVAGAEGRVLVTELSATGTGCAHARAVVADHETGMAVEARRGYTCSSARSAVDGRDVQRVRCLGADDAGIRWTASGPDSTAVEPSESDSPAVDPSDPGGAAVDPRIVMPLHEAFEACKDTDVTTAALELGPDGRDLELRTLATGSTTTLDCLLRELDAPQDLAAAIRSSRSPEPQFGHDQDAGMSYSWSYADGGSVTLDVQDARFG